jgi:hypothetical protein
MGILLICIDVICGIVAGFHLFLLLAVYITLQVMQSKYRLKISHNLNKNKWHCEVLVLKIQNILVALQCKVVLSLIISKYFCVSLLLIVNDKERMS